MEMLINGQLIDKKEKIDVINPFNNKLVDRVPEGSREDVLDAIMAAKNAKKVMNDLSARKIYEILFKISRELDNHLENFAELITKETGKPIKDSIE